MSSSQPLPDPDPDSQTNEHLLHPLVPSTLTQNTLTLNSHIHAPLSFLLGLCSAILGLQALQGFAFYVLGSICVGVLVGGGLVRRSGGGGHGAAAGSGGGAGNGRVGDFFPTKSARRSKTTTKGSAGGWMDWTWVVSGVEGLSGFVLGWAGAGGLLR